MHKWLINGIGIVLIIFTILWFWVLKIRKKKVFEDSGEVIVANSVYTPSTIKIPKGKKIKLRFIRKDPSPCAEWVLFPKLKIAHPLPINKPYTLEIIVDEPGEYEFTCQMGMYRGKLIVY